MTPVRLRLYRISYQVGAKPHDWFVTAPNIAAARRKISRVPHSGSSCHIVKRAVESDLRAWEVKTWNEMSIQYSASDFLYFEVLGDRLDSLSRRCNRLIREIRP